MPIKVKKVMMNIFKSCPDKLLHAPAVFNCRQANAKFGVSFRLGQFHKIIFYFYIKVDFSL